MSRRILLALLCTALAGGLALAQSAAPFSKEAQEASARARGFDEAAAQASSAAARARAEAEALVARIEASEAEISAARARVRVLDAELAERASRLAERQQPLLRLTAALQAMARRPPALALAQPGSIRETARVRAVLAATLPVVRRRTAWLRGELAAAERIRAQGRAAVEAVAARRQDLLRHRTALARLEESQSRRSAALAQSALSETDRSIALTEEARDFDASVRSRASQAELARSLAALPPPPLRPGSAAPPQGPAPYRLPLQGRLVTGFGEISDAGIHARGTTLRAATDTEVLAPRHGTIAYAGRFRSYGEVVILDHGGGWTTTVTNLAALRVAKGARVAAGDPLGRATAGAEVAVELRLNGRPMPIALYL
ncbi:MAG TPA: peptidoglycan DD-metalloendopeptidase family protein [Allosphingosinicella sp.]